MKAKLIYHSKESRAKDISLIDNTIRNMILGEDVLIVCPFLGIEYLKLITAMCKSWKLLTDINAWVDSYKSNPKQLSQIRDFIFLEEEHIRHYWNIHAKVIITTEKALIGSANFTKQGLYDREEMDIVVEDSKQINELSDWYTQLWDQTEPLSKKDLNNITKYVSACQLHKPLPENTRQNKLILQKPKNQRSLSEPHFWYNEEEFPTDIPTVLVNGKDLSTISDLATKIASEKNIKKDSARRWIYSIINNQKIQVYLFHEFYLLDSEAVKTLWLLRSQNWRRSKNRTSSTITSKIIKISNEQLLCVEDVASLTGKSQAQILRLIKLGKITPKFKLLTYIFDPSIVEVIQLLPDLPKNREHKVTGRMNDKKWLNPLTETEKFVIDKDGEGYTYQQIVDMAREEGLLKTKTRDRARVILENAKSKYELAKIYGIDLANLKNRIQLNSMEPIV